MSGNWKLSPQVPNAVFPASPSSCCAAFWASWPGFPGSGFEVVDETYDPCGTGTHCTRLRYDLEVIDTPVGGGLDHVPAIDGPGWVFVSVGETLVECFTAPLPPPVPPTRAFMSILDDGWMSITGVALGTGTLAVRLLDAERDMMLTVR